MQYAISDSQQKAARVVGLVYLFALIAGIFAEFYVSGRIIDYENAAATAKNIVAHERLFRLGILSNLLVFAADVALIAALYVILERVNRNLALLAVFFRLIETMILVVVTLNDFAVLRILSGANYLAPFEPDRLQAMARLAISAHNDTYRIGLLFFGFGSSVFGYLWLKSGYLPKVLAAWGLFASALVGVCMLAFVIFPGAAKIVTVQYYAAPIFLFELGMSVWLPLKGLAHRPVETKNLVNT